MNPQSNLSAPSRRKRRVLLVRAIEEPFNPIFYNHMSLGLLWVNAGLKRYCKGLESRILEWDCLGEPAIQQRFNWYDNRSMARISAFSKYLDEFRPSIVAISAYSSFMPLAIDIAAAVRLHDKKVPVVLGGFHASAYPGSIVKYPMFDFFIRREGVRVFPRLVNFLFDGRPGLKTIRSVSYRDENGDAAINPLEQLPADLDEIPPVDWDDVDIEDYRRHRYAHIVDDTYIQFPKGKLVLYEASQGCGQRCRFCEQGMQHGQTSRHFSVARILTDLEKIRGRFGCEGVFFTDEHMHEDRAWFNSLLAGLRKKSNLGLKYTMAVKADEIGKETIDRLIDAGFVQLSSYPESGSARIRASMGKNIDIDKHLRVMEYASRQGVIVFSGFVVGWPGETVEEVDMSYGIAGEPYIDHVHMLPLSYLGRAPIGRLMSKLGVEPDTQQYFHMLNNPTERSLAAYPNDLYRYFVEGRVKSLNRLKIESKSTRMKFERLGWKIVNVQPGQEPRSGCKIEGKTKKTGRTGGLDSRMNRLRRLFDGNMIPALSNPLYTITAPSLGIRKSEAKNEVVLELKLSHKQGALDIILTGLSESPSYLRTKHFNICYGNTARLTDGDVAAIAALRSGLEAWEKKARDDKEVGTMLKLIAAPV